MTLSGIFVYPIKSCRGVARTHHEVGRTGFHLDRRWMLVDEQGLFLSQRAHPVMATIGIAIGAEHLIVTSGTFDPLMVPFDTSGSRAARVRVWDDAVEALEYPNRFGRWFSDILGLPCRLVYVPDATARPVSEKYGQPGDRVGFADAYPFLLISEASLEDLNHRLAEPVPMDRFRPNLVITGSSRFAEDHWRRIRIGKLTFRVVKPCMRCTVPGVDQLTGLEGKEPMATLAQFRRQGNGVVFGQNVIHDGTGILETGMNVDILESRS
jgi:uncharacterized protein